MNFLGKFCGKISGSMKGFGMKLDQSKPEIMLVVGALDLLGAAVLACTKTEKCKEIVQKTKEEAKKVELSLPMPVETEDITVAPSVKREVKLERGRQYVRVYGTAMLELTKLYVIPALMWGSGMGFIVGGHMSLRKSNSALVSQVLAGTQALTEYRGRVRQAVGAETEEKIFQGTQNGEVLVLEKDEKTGEEHYVKKNGDEFYAQPGSIFAVNFTEENTDIKFRTFTDEYINNRVEMINQDLEWGLARAYTGIEIMRKLGVTEFGLGDNDERLRLLCMNGISGNARKVPDPEMRKLKVTRLRGYQKRFDVAKNMDVWVPCLRLDFNFYPLEGKI